MSIIAPSKFGIVYLPQVVIGVDPDARRTAYAVWVRDPTSSAPTAFSCAEVDGGGSGRESVAWGDVVGADALVRRWAAWAGWVVGAHERGEGEPPVAVCVEAQLASGGAHSSDVEGCRRSRWHWDAACLLLGVPIVHVDPGAWEPRTEIEGRPVRDVKAEYRRRALALDPRARNEDRAAAVMIGAWLVRSLGGTPMPSESAKRSS